ncbi:MAG: bifunctional diguanylate cyclase/phosphodiesterase [Acidobacteriota bacterium]|nr:bifunctional diguanylate cyclase/phosphodiesterase [Acidobacteriota bacterium]
MTFFKFAVILLGGLSFAFAVLNFDLKNIGWGFLLLTIFTLTLAPRMSLNMPRSQFSLSFSDSVIFLTFLLFGGEAAIILASLEAVASCLFLKRIGVKFSRGIILFNFGMTSLATTITYFAWQSFAAVLGISHTSSNTTHLITILGILALSQFLSTTAFVATFYSLKTDTNPWQAWQKEGFTSSLTQIAGAALAGVIFKLINYANPLATVIALLAVGIAYLNYRRMIAEINESIQQAEKAEREKAEVERARAEQAEKYIEELNELLHGQEKISEELRHSKDLFEHAALHDMLTKLANRAFLIEKLEFLLTLNKNNSAARFYVLFLDLTRFKNINDSLGHTIGDKVLMLVAKRLLRAVNPEDTVARLGGDEFAIILSDPLSVNKAEAIAHDIHQKLTQPFSLRGNRIFTKLHIGLAAFDTDYKKPEDILRDADIAMHHAKEKGLDVAVFDKDLRAHFLESVGLEQDLRYAIDRGELSMFYQPLICLKNGELIGFEALLRWQHSKRGFVPPIKFIPIAEDSGLIIPITEWILKETANQLAVWQKISPDYKKLIVSVNISGKHLAVEGLIEQVSKTLEISKIRPSTLKLEITESTAMENAERSAQILNRLKELGVQLSIDDFGTGFSSLSQLHRLPFDTLKIDRSFVNTVNENGENSEILQTIISLAKNLRMKVIAEGIETENQLALLRNLGCDYGQGYLLAKPMPRDEMEKLLYLKHFWFPESFSAEYSSHDTTNIGDSAQKDANLPVF